MPNPNAPDPLRSANERLRFSAATLPAGRAPRWFVWLGLLALAGYAILLGVNSTTAAGGSDASGYLNSARLLVSGRLESPTRLPPAMSTADLVSRLDFQPLGFSSVGDGSRLLPTYPSGLPLHLALAGKVLGWSRGILFVGLAGAIAAVWLCYAVGREIGLNVGLAAAAAVVLAVCPVMLFTSIQPLSDTLATTWCLAAVWAALRARRQGGWAPACGAAYGIAVLVRPTNALLLPALLVLIGLDWRRLAFFALGGLPAAGWLAFYNQVLYGGPFRSGYFSWSEFFAVGYFKPAASYFLHWLAVFLPPVLLVLPLATLWRRDTRSRELGALALWFAAITGLYVFCAFSHEAWTCLRYILPAMPALILAGMLGVEALARLFPTTRAHRVHSAAAFLIAAWAVGMSWYWSPRHGALNIRYHEDAYRAAAATALAQFPPNTLVLCCHHSGAVYFYTDFPILRWDTLYPAEFAHYVSIAQRTGVTLAAVLFSDEEQRALRERCPGEWTRIATADNVGLWRLTPSSSRTE